MEIGDQGEEPPCHVPGEFPRPALIYTQGKNEVG